METAITFDTGSNNATTKTKANGKCNYEKLRFGYRSRN